MGSGISITPPWAGTLAPASTAPSKQARPLWVLGAGPVGGGTGGEREPQGRAKPSSCPVVKMSRTSKAPLAEEVARQVLGGCMTTTSSPPGLSSLATTQEDMKPLETPPPQDKNLLHPSAHQILSCSPPWSSYASRARRLSEGRNPVFHERLFENSMLLCLTVKASPHSSKSLLWLGLMGLAGKDLTPGWEKQG